MIDGEIDGVDRLDRRILAALQGDGRMTNTELAERIGLSATATADRVRRLSRDGFILGYRAELDPVRLGRGLLVFVEVLLDRTSPDVFDSVCGCSSRCCSTAPAPTCSTASPSR
jgi:Lrp/AsnC family transcriptional regulator, leucine-responsive regulatory protein